MTASGSKSMLITISCPMEVVERPLVLRPLEEEQGCEDEEEREEEEEEEEKKKKKQDNHIVM